jgi:16S rRNA (uracil1498-N3)-methyltransferase
MHHFFITPGQINKNEIIITGNDVRHIKNVLRLVPGDEISISDGINPSIYQGVITDINNDIINCEIITAQQAINELPAKISLFQALPKADKMELIIQKAVELGVYEIIPFTAARSIVRLDEKKAYVKTKRWQTISEAAAKQSHRHTIPSVREIISFAEAITAAANMDIRIIPYEKAEDITNTKNIIASIKAGQEVAVFIGPEGGFTPQEIDFAVRSGIKPVSMGKRILRTETAALVILSWIMYQLET